MMMMSFGALGLVSVLWVLYGYSMAFGDDVGGGLLGDPFQYAGLGGLMEDATAAEGGLPAMAFVGFQAVFAIITVALVSGAVAERMKFGGWMVFAGIWATLVYFPVAHWVFDFSLGDHVGGWIANDLAAIDFAGGTAVHINAGAAALALAIVLGSRRGFGAEAMRPHNLPLVMLGAGLLWFGWFGFNAGSAVAANNTAAVAWVNTLVAAAAASLAWLATEKLVGGYATSLGAASGVVAGLVAITPACSSVSPLGAIVVGGVAGILCSLAIGAKFRFGYDDSLDVVAVHLVGGLWGTVVGRLPRHRGGPGRRRRPVLRRRCGPARAPGRRGARRAGLLLRGHLRDRQGARLRHGPTGRRGARGRGHRRRACTRSRATSSACSAVGRPPTEHSGWNGATACCEAVAPFACPGLLRARHDPQVPDRAAVERGERLLVGRAVVRGTGCVDRLEHDDHGAGHLAGLVGLLGHPADDERAARPPQRRTRQLGVRRDLGLVGDLPVDADPVGTHGAHPVGRRVGPGCRPG